MHNVLDMQVTLSPTIQYLKIMRHEFEGLNIMYDEGVPHGVVFNLHLHHIGATQIYANNYNLHYSLMLLYRVLP